SRQTADSVSRVEEIQRLSEFVGSKGAEALVDSFLVIMSLALVFYYSPQLGVALMATGLAVLLLSINLGAVIYSQLPKTIQYQAEALKIFIEAVRKITLLRSCAAEPHWITCWHEESMRAGKVLRQIQNLGSFLNVISQLTLRATPLVVVFAGTFNTPS